VSTGTVQSGIFRVLIIPSLQSQLKKSPKYSMVMVLFSRVIIHFEYMNVRILINKRFNFRNWPVLNRQIVALLVEVKTKYLAKHAKVSLPKQLALGVVDTADDVDDGFLVRAESLHRLVQVVAESFGVEVLCRVNRSLA
jgi:hypothetical protein